MAASFFHASSVESYISVPQSSLAYFMYFFTFIFLASCFGMFIQLAGISPNSTSMSTTPKRSFSSSTRRSQLEGLFSSGFLAHRSCNPNRRALEVMCAISQPSSPTVTSKCSIVFISRFLYNLDIHLSRADHIYKQTPTRHKYYKSAHLHHNGSTWREPPSLT